MKNSKLLLIVLSNLAQTLFYLYCYKQGLGLLIFEYCSVTLGLSIVYTVNKIVDNKTKMLYFCLLSGIPVYLLSLLFMFIINLIKKLIIYLDSKEQIIK